MSRFLRATNISGLELTGNRPSITNEILTQPFNVGSMIGTVPFQPGSLQPIPFQPGAFQPVPGTPQAPSAPAGTSNIDLQVLLASLPVAEDGHVITSEHFNLLRAAIIALAGQLGAGFVTPTFTQTLTPSFFPVSSNQWSFANGVATKTKGTANGLLPVLLPDGVSIQKMRVIGERKDAMQQFEVLLQRQPIADAKPASITTLIRTSLADAGATFNVVAEVEVSGLGAAAAAVAIQDLQFVDNSKYKYFIVANAVTASDTAEAHINTIQLEYQR
ncbi:MAG: hypothetical protein J2P37_07100 [Ktedonobacteraceae bacterium]|nr:hypothetical protein [Ktedonobacteraceae bacterium]